MKKLTSKVHKIDARKFDEILKEPIVSVTITSPPYFDLKDYGYKGQIGYGQKYEDYLDDLKIVFKNVHSVTKDTGTLWVIIDAFRRDGEVTPLPFDFSNKIKDVGWKLQEIIIWGKDRTVPWTHKGQMRNLFEYILVFSKSKDYAFHIDKIRDFESLKRWWVKYPERYNPKGKTPDAIWHFDIPVQGSWGDGYIKHFCPLPEEMISQILKLTTKEGDLVLDPFAGSGAVLAKAHNMKRDFIGFELNGEYIKMFEDYQKKTSIKKRKEYEVSQKQQIPRNKFRNLIIDLRALKYARLLYTKLKTQREYGVTKIYVERSPLRSFEKNSIVIVEYHFLIKQNCNKEKLLSKLQRLINKKPLSKFGIQAKFHFIQSEASFKSKFRSKSIYIYTDKITYKHSGLLRLKDFEQLTPSKVIFSKIKVDLDEKDYI